LPRSRDPVRDEHLCVSGLPAADARLNAAYKKRVATLDKAQLERLRTAQRAWISHKQEAPTCLGTNLGDQETDGLPTFLLGMTLAPLSRKGRGK